MALFMMRMKKVFAERMASHAPTVLITTSPYFYQTDIERASRFFE